MRVRPSSVSGSSAYERVVEPRVERARAPRARRRRPRPRPRTRASASAAASSGSSRLRGEEAPGQRRRHAAGARDGREQLVAVRDREHALAVADVVDRARSPRRSRRAAAPPCARARPARRRRRSTRRRAPPPAAPTSVATSPALPRSTVDVDQRRGCGAPSSCGTRSRRRRPGRARPGSGAPFAAPPASSIASTQWPESVPMLSTSDDAMPRHLLDLLAARAPSPAARRARASRSPSRS